ncbi:sensor histidine kinase [Paenibacillus flagellatus]|uniref:histidine kinase n=1 Tax=Paenibacillus flagellatus TaxID=2211139 RepID=A0A2V5JYS6_9BACL|nr:sensor histidine kinase [Paenibacillus flagellatus]PYI52035.1 sensor histidine kinase [Paenibacillus flagellatus]
MGVWLNKLLPQKIKHRFFFSFVLFVLIPLLLLQLYYYRSTERLIVEKIQEQSGEQLSLMKSEFNEMTNMALLQWIALERSRDLVNALRESDGDVDARSETIREAIDRSRSRAMPLSRYLHYSVADLAGVQASSAEAEGGQPEPGWGAKALEKLQETGAPYKWIPGVPNYLPAGLTWSGKLLTLIATIRDGDALIGVIRISFDYETWLKEAAKNFPVLQTYYILDETGQALAQTEPTSRIRPAVVKKLTSAAPKPAYWVEESNTMLYGSTWLLPERWQIVCAFPLRIYFGDLKLLERRFLLTFLVLTGIFILLTLFISASVTRPLKLLKNKMEGMVRAEMKTFLPEQAYRGELSALARAFNRMVSDMHLMVDRLKREERQRESVRFQMLISQVNPHFLLNTLNTLKWHAIDKDDQTAADICKRLSKLLESSLTDEADLIHLQDEIDLVEAYVRIQKFRYDDRFAVQYEYDEQLRYALVPKLSLQPLVDNCITHGFPRMEKQGIIRVRVFRAGDKLVMEVQDNGQGVEEAEKKKQRRIRKGIGLTNVRERLQLLFKREAELELIALEEGALVRVAFPLLLADPYQAEGGDVHVETDHRRRRADGAPDDPE